MAAATQKQQTEQQASPAQNRGAVAVIAPPRLPYHESIEQRFGVDKSAWKALCESVFPTAKTSGAIVLALSYCKARKLDPFKKPVHIVPIYDSQKREYVESVWPGIGEHRTTAFRTGTYAGMEACIFGETVTEVFKDKVKDGQGWKTVEVEVTFPTWAQVTIYRMVQGNRVQFPGPRVMWREFYSRMGRSIIPNDRWQKAPIQMIEKCAEAGALRRAFPEELGDDWTADETGFLGGSDAKDITPDPAGPSVPAQEPTRGQFRQQAPDVTDEHDAETGEIIHDGHPPGDNGAPSAGETSGEATQQQTSPEVRDEEPDWAIPNGPTEKQAEAALFVIDQTRNAADIEAFRKTNETLLKKWGTGKPDSAYARSLAAVNEATAEKLKTFS